ncbi:MAG: cellulose biosynthesis protein BcsS [Hyphomicrobium sp.]|nr:cellulose biosynthesis protein BcsS [Hyphomicrobium sp.]
MFGGPVVAFGVSRHRLAIRLALNVGALTLSCALPVRAGEPAAPQDTWNPAAWARAFAEPSKSHKWRETWAGVDASDSGWLIYSGVTLAPWSHIHEPGFRVRIAGGSGGYRYEGERYDADLDDSVIRRFRATPWFTDVLVGYLERWGPLTAKAFAGVSGVGHAITPIDVENAVVGDDIGAKAVVELWLDIGNIGFASLDLSWSEAHRTRSARTRLGWRAVKGWSVGWEAWLDLDAQSDCELGWDDGGACQQQFTYGDGEASILEYTRAGIFLRTDWDGGEVSVSAGVSGGLFQGGATGDIAPEPYVTVNWIRQF